MRYFRFVRIYSLVEVTVFTGLILAAVGKALGGGAGFERAALVLGWTHGIGWILLCVAVYEGCRRRVFPWPLLAATVSPLGPLGSTIGIEWLARRRRPARRQLA